MASKLRSGIRGLVKRRLLARTRGYPRVHVPLLKLALKAAEPSRRFPSMRLWYEDGWKVSSESKTWEVPAPQRGYGIVLNGMQGAKDELSERYFPEGDFVQRCRGRTVVDVGAHIGVFTMAALDAGAARVIAFEPDPAAYACLQANVGDDPRTELYPMMLGQSDGYEDLFVATASGDSSMIPPPEWHTKTSVEMRRVDSLDLGLSDGDVVKVEAEGAEPEVLIGASGTLAGKSLFLTVRASYERQGNSTFADCQRILEEYGYRCWAGDMLDPPKQLLADLKQ